MGIVLFDGVCNLCNGAVRFIIKRDRFGKFRFASLQSDAGRALLEQNGVTHRGTGSIVYIPQQGDAFRESSAVLYILKELGRGWQLFFPLIHYPPSCGTESTVLLPETATDGSGKKKNACCLRIPPVHALLSDEITKGDFFRYLMPLLYISVRDCALFYVYLLTNVHFVCTYIHKTNNKNSV